MQRIFYPKSIVVIGVSEKPDNLARQIVNNLRAFAYPGDLYAVGLREGVIQDLPIVDSLDKVPDGLDLAVILTPASVVPQLMEKCGQKGIRRVVVESGGFSEFSEEGRQLEAELLEVARRYEMRVVGPNCISVINLEAGVCLPFAPLSPGLVQLGSASVIAQSGGVSLTYLGMLSAAGVGVNKVVSIGNKADLDEADYLEYLLADEGTEIICQYLESIDEGRRLMDLALQSEKPIIVHKANRSPASQAVAFSHTAALANDDRIVDAAFRQAGILRAESFRELVTFAKGLKLPPVRGKNLVIISRSGGHAVAAADAAARAGFRLPPLPAEFIKAVRAYFRADVIALTNPLDLGVIFDFEIYAQIVEQCLRALSPDAILLINTYGHAEVEGARTLAGRVGEIVHELNLPIALCEYSDVADVREVQQKIGVPVYDDIDEALCGLAASRRWNHWQRRRSQIAKPAIRPMEAETERPAETTLTTDQALALCQEYGIETASWGVVDSPKEAARLGEQLGLPVALKLLSEDLVHKSDMGGVAVGLATLGEVRESATAMLAQFGETISGSSPPRLLVQRMVSGGVEMILGGKRDHSFGPVVMFGLGGIHVELYDDVAFRVAPLSRDEAEAMVEEVRASQLLRGWRGRPAVNREALIQALLALSALMMEEKRVIEIDINPLIVTAEAAVAVDARARVWE